MTYQIDRLFGSKTRVALITKLMMNVERSYYLRELSEELKIPYSMLFKEKNTLLELGIITEEKRGKINLISVNRGLPYFSELKSLFLKTSGIIGVIGKSLQNIEGIKYALIYGSFAEGKETISSDVDLLIIGDADEEKVLDTVNDVEKTTNREINYILWDEKDYQLRLAGNHHLLVNILKGKIMMLVGSENEFRGIAER